MTYTELKPLLQWRLREKPKATPHELANMLSVEGLAYTHIPKRHFERLTAFRKRRQDGRLALCQRFLKQ